MDKARPRHGEIHINPHNRDISIWDETKEEWLHLSGEEFLDKRFNFKRPLGSRTHYPRYPQPDLLCAECGLPYYDCMCDNEETGKLPFDLTLEDELFEI